MGKVSCLCIAVVFVYLVASVFAKESTDSDTNVVAYWSDYDPPANDWDLAKVGVACSSKLEDMPLEWRSQYEWTGFCAEHGPQNLDGCGRCVLVTNTKNGKQVKLRIVDTCGVGGLVMDLRPFNEIDDGTGHLVGHHIVDYEIVDCDTESTDSDTNVVAYWSDYDPPANDWDLAKVGVACSSQLEGMTLEWRSQYDWTGFCGEHGPQNLDACGRCILVTNTKNGKQVKLRIVDTCGLNGLVMDLRPFDEIDDGTGHINGHHVVDYEFVECGDTSTTRFISMKMPN
ncbi:Barwin domain-containing protein [Cephalotus follicularis]|uniref:Barwin domain-containing protein n=1 Tax=Cephalotus follicularis TaxID=3775 RepID=A0A1Q3C6R2_CEPFO|nr:Barwin domain-containing protein [Cephalotus follicularis]